MQILAKILRKLKVASFFNQRVILVENGRRFHIPLFGELGYSNLALTEPWMTTLFKKLPVAFQRANGLFVDVGVNIGQTLLKLRSVYPDQKYVGFEPNPTCVYYVNALVEANRFHDVTVYPVGISNENAVLSLNLYGDQGDDSAASLVENFRPDQKVVRSIHVPVFSCDSLAIGVGIAFLKIDVEGGELEVLTGFRGLLCRDRPLILTEILPVYQSSNSMRLERQENIEAMMHEINYSCFRVMHPADQFEGLVPVEKIGIHSSVEWSDYLWIPSERVSEVAACVLNRN